MEKQDNAWTKLPNWPIRTPWPADITIRFKENSTVESKEFRFLQVARIREKERFGESEKWFVFPTLVDKESDPLRRQMWRVGRITDRDEGWFLDVLGNAREPFSPTISHNSMQDTPQIELDILGKRTDDHFQFFTFVAAHEKLNEYHVIGGIEWSMIANSKEPKGHDEFQNSTIYNYSPPRTLRDSSIYWTILSDAVERFDKEFNTNTILVDGSVQ